MCIHVAAKVLHTSGFVFTMDIVPSSYVQNSFLSQQYTIVSEALKCTVLLRWIIPVKTYRLYRGVQLASRIIYIYTHLLNVPLL